MSFSDRSDCFASIGNRKLKYELRKLEIQSKHNSFSSRRTFFCFCVDGVSTALFETIRLRTSVSAWKFSNLFIACSEELDETRVALFAPEIASAVIRFPSPPLSPDGGCADTVRPDLEQVQRGENYSMGARLGSQYSILPGKLARFCFRISVFLEHRS